MPPQTRSRTSPNRREHPPRHPAGGDAWTEGDWEDTEGGSPAPPAQPPRASPAGGMRPPSRLARVGSGDRGSRHAGGEPEGEDDSKLPTPGQRKQHNVFQAAGAPRRRRVALAAACVFLAALAWAAYVVLAPPPRAAPAPASRHVLPTTEAEGEVRCAETGGLRERCGGHARASRPRLPPARLGGKAAAARGARSRTGRAAAAGRAARRPEARAPRVSFPPFSRATAAPRRRRRRGARGAAAGASATAAAAAAEASAGRPS